MSNDPFGFEAIQKPGRWWPHDELAEHDREVAERQREEDAALADRWLSHAANFPFAFMDGPFVIERNAAANLVPDAIRNSTPPPNEPRREIPGGVAAPDDSGVAHG